VAAAAVGTWGRRAARRPLPQAREGAPWHSRTPAGPPWQPRAAAPHTPRHRPAAWGILVLSSLVSSVIFRGIRRHLDPVSVPPAPGRASAAPRPPGMARLRGGHAGYAAAGRGRGRLAALAALALAAVAARATAAPPLPPPTAGARRALAERDGGDAFISQVGTWGPWAQGSRARGRAAPPRPPTPRPPTPRPPTPGPPTPRPPAHSALSTRAPARPRAGRRRVHEPHGPLRHAARRAARPRRRGAADPHHGRAPAAPGL
jgi:hypothetical protein